jgi:hypothetical protein
LEALPMRMLIAPMLSMTGTALPAAEPPAAAHAAQVRGVDDPRAFVQATYDSYRTGPDSAPEWPDHAYSDRLRALFNAAEAWAAGHEDLVGPLDFDWWINGQDWELGRVALEEMAGGPDRRTIVARFDNFGRSEENRFLFVREQGRWYLDDAVNEGGEDGWVLSEILQERPE